MAATDTLIVRSLAAALSARPEQIRNAVALLDDGKTVPFIARYRKEATGGLTDAQLRDLEVRLVYLRELEARRAQILERLAERGVKDPALEDALEAAQTKQELEDLYAPYRPQRRTRAAAALEAGLGPLADRLFGPGGEDPAELARAYLVANSDYDNVRSVLNGARDILAQRLADRADLRRALRALYRRQGELVSKAVEEAPQAADKYRDYFDAREPLRSIPSHRALAALRGAREALLKVTVELPAEEEALVPHPAEALIAETVGIVFPEGPRGEWLRALCRWTWRVKCRGSLETELLERLREEAEETAIGVFGENLRDLLLAAPAGQRTVIGLDPGLRTGVKCAVVDATGRVLETGVLHLTSSAAALERARADLAAWIRRFSPDFVAIGNGTASRETTRFAREVLAELSGAKARIVVVSEAGASVYSASELAGRELPGLDVTYRGAVSIARRLQDPLAELVKIDPKAIGVGQYQHDLNASRLETRLDAVVEDCVNAVGVDVNTASPSLLARIAGLNAGVAERIVAWREKNGLFRNRRALLEVPTLGVGRFEQCAGFLRIHGGDEPLDATGVHPEAYGIARRILARLGRSVEELAGNRAELVRLRPSDYVDGCFGEPTVRDIIAELEKPGRDPRPEFRGANFDETVCEITDLKPGMVLEGVVRNVAAFGAFVDIGVHENGLVHVSELADRRVEDPRTVVRAGDVVKVRVLAVDLERGRISLSMRSKERRREERVEPRSSGSAHRSATALANAFAKARR